MNIGKNITAFRKDAGMTQEDLAGQIGVSPPLMCVVVVVVVVVVSSVVVVVPK